MTETKNSRGINYLVETKAIPHPNDLPCMDCLDEVFLNTYRHEYDHARGYDGENQLHPCIVPFDALSIEQQAKDYIFRGVVHELKRFLS